MGPTREEIMEMLELKEKKRLKELKKMESEWPTPTKYTPPSVEADAQYDLQSDTILVRVRRRYKDANGVMHRRGVTFRIDDCMLEQTPEGCDYIQKKIDRFESIVDEVE